MISIVVAGKAPTFNLNPIAFARYFVVFESQYESLAARSLRNTVYFRSICNLFNSNWLRWSATTIWFSFTGLSWYCDAELFVSAWANAYRNTNNLHMLLVVGSWSSNNFLVIATFGIWWACNSIRITFDAISTVMLFKKIYVICITCFRIIILTVGHFVCWGGSYLQII